MPNLKWSLLQTPCAEYVECNLEVLFSYNNTTYSSVLLQTTNGSGEINIPAGVVSIKCTAYSDSTSWPSSSSKMVIEKPYVPSGTNYDRWGYVRYSSPCSATLYFGSSDIASGLGLEVNVFSIY